MLTAKLDLKNPSFGHEKRAYAFRPKVFFTQLWLFSLEFSGFLTSLVGYSSGTAPDFNRYCL
jgi:hypothetical protein